MTNSDIQVIVVGAGPTGLATGLGLARRGVRVLILDRDAQIGRAPRAMIHLYPVLDGFEDLGILGDVEAAGFRVACLNIVDWAAREIVPQDMNPLDGVLDRAYNLSLGQDRLTEVLLQHLQRHPGAEVRRDVAVTSVGQDTAGVWVETGGPQGPETIRAGWLVGTDGATSTVRHSLDLGFTGLTWPDRFVAVDLVHDYTQDGYGDANFIVHPVYGGVVARIDERKWRYTYREDESLPEESIRERMAELVPASFLGQDKSWDLVQFAPYKMHQRAADTFRAGRVLLAGDAAHVTNPIGGLGLTGGFLDAFALAPALAAVVRGEAPEDVLTDYARERRRVFWEYVSPMATSNKQLVFHLDDKARAAAMAGIRMMAATPEMRAAQLLGMSAMVTPPLLDQRSSCKEGLPTYPLPRHAVERWWVGGEPVDGPLGTVMRGQMYIETLHPAESDRRADRPPIVLVHGGGGQGLDWLVTPDGRPGWAPLLADQGWTVHVVDRPGHGRSPLSPEVLGTPMPPMGAEALSPIFLPPVAGPDSHPGAALHTQWPGGRSPGDPVFDQFLSGQGPMPADMEVAQRLEQAALAALLDRIGPAVMITHSAGGPAGWLAADERPEQVLALVAIEVLGPPFLDRPDHGLRLPWGLTSAPLTLDPPVDDPAILHEGVHQLVNLTGIPIVLVAAEASPMRWIQPMIANFLAQHGCTVEQLRLWEHGVHGNGHAMMLERNHRAVLKAVMARVQDILEARGAANERTTASMLNT